MRVVSLGSSSSGNALLVEAGPGGRTKLLVDAGLNGRAITERLANAGTSPAQLTGMLLTHEHSDHVQGVPFLVKRFGTRLIADARTFEAVERSIAQGAWNADIGAARLHLAQSLPVGSTRRIDDIEVTSFPVSHDAVAPCGYLLSAGGCRVCLVTDSGEVTTEMLAMMGEADLLVIEANHDRRRLLRGPYPQMLKRRILSSTGHLSNDQAAEALLRTWRGDSVRWVWLSHLSRTNNTPMLALSSVRERLLEAGANLAQVHLTASPPGMGGIWDSTRLWSVSSLWDMHWSH